jgi:Na+:H+ antiporter, NhaA family
VPSIPSSPNRDRSGAPVLTVAHELWRGVHQTLRNDVVAGALLLGATAAAVILANSPAVDLCQRVRGYSFGPTALDLDLRMQAWSADGLLVIFFFVVGLELKEELVAGRLRHPWAATVPIAAGLGGVATPALVFVATNASAGGEALRGGPFPPPPTSRPQWQCLPWSDGRFRRHCERSS